MGRSTPVVHVRGKPQQLSYIFRKIEKDSLRCVLLFRAVCVRGIMGLANSFKSIRQFFFLFEFTSPRTYDPGFRFFVKQMFKTRGEKSSKFFFPAKMCLNSGEPSTRTVHALPCLHTQ